MAFSGLKKRWNAYRLLVVRLMLVVRSPGNNWTLRSVAYSLQDGCLASICTSYNEDSERNLWGFSAGCCGNEHLVSHVSWFCGSVADRSDPYKDPHLPSLAIRNGKRSIGCTCTVTHACARATLVLSLRLSTKSTFPHLTYTGP